MRRALLLLAALPALAHADEGMWLFNDFPAADVKKAYGFSPDAKWLEKVRLGALRLANGCSASFVSKDGLVLTNHHCVRSCLEDLSTPQRDLLSSPFVAKSRDKEEPCAAFELNQLVAITDVSARVLAAVKDHEGAEFQKRLKMESAQIEQDCAGGDRKKRCDVVSLFNGAKFHLYQYRRFQDVRLVFAPEFPMAAFGGDPDNFNFPRYGVDMALLRVWEDGKPRSTPEALKLKAGGANENDLVFVAGHPGGTERSRTIAHLELQRDVVLPWALLNLAEMRGRLDQWMQGDPERTRVTRSRLRSVENGLKAYRGRYEALVAPGFLDQKRAEEASLREKAPAETKGAWELIATAATAQRRLHGRFRLLEVGEAFQSELFGHARMLVRNAEETAKPNGERLPEYSDARKPFLLQQLAAPAPIAKDLEKATLTWSLTRLRNLLGADDPLVRDVLGRESPDDLAAKLVDGTSLHDVTARQEVLDGKRALDSDPMLVFAKNVDAAARAVRKQYEDEADAPFKKGYEQVAEARKAVLGTTGYPDATFTLRLSYGAVKGYGAVKPFTTVQGFYDRLTGKPPFAATEPWLKAKAQLKGTTRFDVATTNDIIGGNSGSPLIDKAGDVVGLVFDGNLPSLGGNFGYDGRENRATAVHGDLIYTALEKVYGADAVAKELKR
ncbi:MAG: S46 family peptidase [Myxococcaceae bacterium]|nr:S46 family peptidase [Myxococcaceae bacterium]